MRCALPALLLAIAGCVATRPPEEMEFSSAPVEDVELRRMWTRGELSQLQLMNTSERAVRYLHWFGQGPEPVAYCARVDGSHWLCSEEVFLEGNEESGYTEWGHDTVLRPHSSVVFRVRAGAKTKVGIKVFPAGSGQEQYIWAE